jgi:hypothetical protein
MKDITINLISWINEALRYVKRKIEDKTPEDTKKLVWSYKIQEARQTWNIISWKVYNNTPYAYYVEYWVWGKIYKYNKPKGNIFKLWVWARMITQTKEEETWNITQIIKSKLWTK